MHLRIGFFKLYRGISFLKICNNPQPKGFSFWDFIIEIICGVLIKNL